LLQGGEGGHAQGLCVSRKENNWEAKMQSSKVQFFFLLVALFQLLHAQNETVIINIAHMGPGEVFFDEQVALQLAAEKVNNNTDDYYIQFQFFGTNNNFEGNDPIIFTYKNAIDIIGELPEGEDTTNDTDFNIVIGTAFSSTSEIASLVFRQFDLPIISYGATSITLSDKELYPTFSRVIVSEQVQGGAAAEIVGHFGWPEVASIVVDNSFGLGLESAFEAGCQALSTPVPVLAQEQLSESASDDQISLALENIRKTDVHVIFIATLADLGREIFLAANSKGMLSSDYVWIAVQDLLTDSIFTDPDDGINEGLRDRLRGLIGTRRSGGSGPEYEEFLVEMEQRGVDFLSEFNVLAFDCLFFVSKAIECDLAQGGDARGTSLLDCILNSTHDGLTGTISLDENGDRQLLGTPLDLVNFRSSNQLDRGEQSFTFDAVGTYTERAAGDESDPIEEDESTVIVWPDGSNKVPDFPSVFDPPSQTYEKYTDPEVLVFIVLLFLLSLITLLITAIVLYSITNTVIKSTGIVYNLTILFGVFMGCYVIYPFIEKPSDELCAWRPWVAIVFFVIEGTLVAKQLFIWFTHWRRSADEKKSLLTIDYPWWVTIAAVSILLAIEIIFLILWTAIDPPKPDRHDVSGEDEVYFRCRSDDHDVWIAVQFSLVGVVILVGVISAIRIYFLPVMWKEGNWIGVTIISTAVISGIALAIVYVLEDIPAAWFSIIGAGVLANLCAVLIFIFGHKLWLVLVMKTRKGEAGNDMEDWQNKGDSDSFKDI